MAKLSEAEAGWPGDFLARPAPLAALAVLVVNDQVIKRWWPGVVSGKLSDIAGLFLAPLVLVGLLEAWRRVRHRVAWTFSRRDLLWAIVATGLTFTAVKISPNAADAFGWANGAVQWPLRGISSAVRGKTVKGVTPTAVVVDGSDLIALVALLPGYLYGTSISKVRSTSAT